MLGTFLMAGLLSLGAGEVHLQRDPYGNMRPCSPRTVILGFRRAAGERLTRRGGEGESRVHRLGARVVDRCEPLGLLRVEVPAGEDPGILCGRLAAGAGAGYAEPDWEGEGGFLPDDPYFSSQWHLQSISGHDVRAVQGWDITRGSTSTVVAVLDTGIDFGHPEFAGRILPGWDWVNDDDDPSADHPHGISSTGILAANGDDGFGVAGMDHRARILPVKILDQNNKGTQWALVQGILWAVDHGARVLNMSLINFPQSNALDDALGYAREHGVVLVACAGNGGFGDADASWPGASPLCITVGATNQEDLRASFSGTGMALDVVAPGQSVQTASADGSSASSSFTGCSAATPVVAGIASLLLSVDPGLTPEEVQSLIEQGAEDLVGGADDTEGWDPRYGWGRVNLRRSLDLLAGRFLRGDGNQDGTVDISDPILGIAFLFLGGGSELPCLRAMDGNDDGRIDISDPISILTFLFTGGTMGAPYPRCGIDVTPDALTCLEGCRG